MVIRQLTPKQVALASEASSIQAALDAAEQRAADLREERITLMRAMVEAKMSWAEIARQFGVTPQAVMYATGKATRQARTTAKVEEVRSPGRKRR